VHSVNSFLKANNVRSSCFTEKQGFFGAKTTTSKPSPHRVLSENPRRHIHVHWFPYVQCYCLRLPSIGTLNLLTRHETKSTARHSITYTANLYALLPWAYIFLKLFQSSNSCSITKNKHNAVFLHAMQFWL